MGVEAAWGVAEGTAPQATRLSLQTRTAPPPLFRIVAGRRRCQPGRVWWGVWWLVVVGVGVCCVAAHIQQSTKKALQEMEMASSAQPVQVFCATAPCEETGCLSWSRMTVRQLCLIACCWLSQCCVCVCVTGGGGTQGAKHNTTNTKTSPWSGCQSSCL